MAPATPPARSTTAQPAASTVPTRQPKKVTYAKDYIRGDNNNPTNLKFGSLTKKWVDSGKATTDNRAPLDGGHFLKFSTLEDGLTAAKDLLQSKSYANLKVDDAMKQWSSDAYDAKELGIPKLGAKKISQLTDEELDQLVERMAHYESGYHVVSDAEAGDAAVTGGGR